VFYTKISKNRIKNEPGNEWRGNVEVSARAIELRRRAPHPMSYFTPRLQMDLSTLPTLVSYMRCDHAASNNSMGMTGIFHHNGSSPAADTLTTLCLVPECCWVTPSNSEGRHSCGGVSRGVSLNRLDDSFWSTVSLSWLVKSPSRRGSSLITHSERSFPWQRGHGSPLPTLIRQVALY